MIKKELKKLGVNKKLLKDILSISINNPDQRCMVDEYKPTTSVCIEALNLCHNPDKYYNLFIKSEIYNIIYMNLEIGMHTFKCKYSSGNIASYTLSKKEYASRLDALAISLLFFINNKDKNKIQH
jgi:hypothetical protein